MADPAAIDALKAKVASILDFPSYPPGNGGLMLDMGGTVVVVRVREEGAQTIVQILVCAMDEVERITDELKRFLALHTARYRFGRFVLLEQGRQIHYTHSLFGAALEPATLRSVINALVATTDELAPELIRLSGGKKLEL